MLRTRFGLNFHRKIIHLLIELIKIIHLLIDWKGQILAMNVNKHILWHNIHLHIYYVWKREITLIIGGGLLWHLSVCFFFFKSEVLSGSKFVVRFIQVYRRKALSYSGQRRDPRSVANYKHFNDLDGYVEIVLSLLPFCFNRFILACIISCRRILVWFCIYVSILRVFLSTTTYFWINPYGHQQFSVPKIAV